MSSMRQLFPSLVALLVIALGGPLVRAQERAQAAAPVAFCFEIADRWTELTGLRRGLEAAGFEVRRLDLSAPPPEQGADLLAFGSFCSESAEWRAWTRAHAGALRAFCERGGTLLQFTQADQTEATPAFLPAGLDYGRTDADVGPLLVGPAAEEHPLVRALPLRELNSSRHFGRPPSWESAGPCEGFQVLLGCEPVTRNPALLEAAVGKGRLLLTSLFLDKTHDADGKLRAPQAYAKAQKAFFAALRRHVVSVRAGQAPEVVVTPTYKKPEPLPFVEGSWTLAVLPDTQVYTMRYPKHFHAQTEWIARNAKARDIRYVLHLGDIVNNNNEPQWKVARAALEKLHGQVPYALAPGNHDYGPGGSAGNRDTLLNRYFPLAEQRRYHKGLGGVAEPGKLDSSYHTFEVRGRKWLILALEWGPRDGVVEWANRICAGHPDYRIILITHAYLYFDGTRYDWSKKGRKQSWNPHAYGTAKLPGGTNDGEQLWRKLVSRHPGFTMTLNGHVLGDGLGRLSSPGRKGNVVHQMLVNFQMKREGGEGYLRLLEFLPDGETVQVKTYSPSLDRHRTDPANQFVLELSRAP